MACPSKRTPEREQRLLQAIRAGNTGRAACAYAGIDQAHVWLIERGRFRSLFLMATLRWPKQKLMPDSLVLPATVVGVLLVVALLVWIVCVLYLYVGDERGEL
jgi:hypothetical protein